MQTDTVNAVADRIEQAVVALSERLEVPAGALWEAGISYVWGIALAEVFIYAILCVAWMVLARRFLPQIADSLDDPSPLRFFGCSVLLVFGILLTVAVLTNGPERVGYLFAPEIGVLRLLGGLF